MTLPMTTPPRPTAPKRNFSALTIEEALGYVPTDDFTPWELNVLEREPGALITGIFTALKSYDLVQSEASKLLLIDAVFMEIAPRHPVLKIWKTRQLESDVLTGFADFLIAPKRAYVKTPLLCVVEAKKDDFEQGQIQCVGEMVACRWNNDRSGVKQTVYGIVSNGTAWQFFALTQQNEVLQSGEYANTNLPKLLGIVDYVFGECAKNVSL